MKGYIKGLIAGLLIGASVTSIPAVAENIDALFNEVRINIGGIDRVSWGENIKFDDGTEAPYSILYNGTTYLPLRKTAELLGKEVYWNGDSKTVSVVDSGSKTTLAEKPDKNGNVWKYSTVETPGGGYYLIAEDSNRGFSRTYKLGSKNIKVTDNEIYFFKDIGASYNNTREIEVIKLLFDNDENTQDGVEVYGSAYFIDGIFDGEYIFCQIYQPGNSGHGEIIAYNYFGDMQDVHKVGVWNGITDMKLEQSDESKAVLSYKKYSMSAPDANRFNEAVTFDKTTNTFVK